jgi:hypothetical protein
MRSRLLISLAGLMLVFCYFATTTNGTSVNSPGRETRLTLKSGSSEWTAFLASRKAAPLGTMLFKEGDNKGIGQSLVGFFGRLGDSTWSAGLHGSRYAYDFIESIHVWTLCLFFGLAVMFDLRLLGWAMRDVPVAELARRLLPWTVAGFVIMVISGLLLFYAIPLRSFQSIFFRIKMIMLLLAGLNVLIFHSGIYQRVETWSLDAKPPRAARVAGAFSLVLWIGIVLSGRMIAYNWFDCDRQPQPAIVNFLTNCVPDGSGN